MKLNILLLIVATLITLSYSTTTPLVLSEIQAFRTSCYAPEPPEEYAYTEEEQNAGYDENQVEEDEGDYEWDEEWDEEDEQYYEEWEEHMEGVEEWEEDFVYFGYECDETECQAFITELEEKLAAATNKIEYCQEWEDYLATNPDENNLDYEKVAVYVQCLEQKGHISTNFPANEVFYCESYSVHDYLIEHGYIEEYSKAEIDTCYQECEEHLSCEGTECSDFIETNWDAELEVCVEVEAQQTQDFTDGLTTSAENFTYYTAAYQQHCIYSQLEENSNFYDVEIDYEDLEETYNEENDTFDFSSLSANQKSVLALACYTECYEDEDEYVDNEDLLVELYGENYHELFEHFYDEDDLFWEEDAWEDWDCEGDDCYDEDGNFIGNIEGESTNPCDENYCYAELWGCIDNCQKEYCPGGNCFVGENTLEKQIEEKCLKFNEENKENEEKDASDIVEPEFYESYQECVQKLKDLIPENLDADIADKSEKQVSLFSCLLDCADAAEESYKENNNLSASQLVFTIFSLVLISLIF